MRRTAAVLVTALVIVACGSSPHPPAMTAGGCSTATLPSGSGPAWAAHSNPPTFLPYAIGAHQTAAAFIFGYPLRAGAPTNPANKILWIVRTPGSGLTIRATPLRSPTPVVTVRVNDSAGPETYPSYVNVPTPGCWHLTVRWRGHTDSIDLSYRPIARVFASVSRKPDPRPGKGRLDVAVPGRCPHTPVDPRTALPLPADALGPATEAALRYLEAPRNDISGFRQRAIAETATRQPPPERSTARYLCGDLIANRTVLVDVTFPRAKPTRSASLSFGIVLVSRFPPNRYLVWFQLH
jgi:hypothetical protein